MLKKLVIGLTALVFLLSTGCNAGASKQAVSETQVCQNLLLLKNSIDNFKDASKFKDAKEMQAYASVVRQNFNNVIQSAANLQTIKTDNLQNAYNDLASAVSSLPADASLQDAVSSLQDQFKAVLVTLDQLNTDLNCKALLPQP